MYVCVCVCVCVCVVGGGVCVYVCRNGKKNQDGDIEIPQEKRNDIHYDP